MAEEVFKLPVSTYEAITRIVRAYGKLNQPSTPEQVSKLAGQRADGVSKNNGFLVSIGVIEGGKKKKITDKGLALSRALEHDMPDEISQHWRNVVLGSEFLRQLLDAISIRKGMDPATLQAHVAYSAGRPKTPEVMTGAAAVVDVLRSSGLVNEDSGKLVATNGDAVSQGGSASSVQVLKGGNEGRARDEVVTSLTPNTSLGGIGVSIQIQIQCSASELDGLGPKIRAMLNELTMPDDAEVGDTGTSDSDEDDASRSVGLEADGSDDTAGADASVESDGSEQEPA